MPSYSRTDRERDGIQDRVGLCSRAGLKRAADYPCSI